MKSRKNTIRKTKRNKRKGGSRQNMDIRYNSFVVDNNITTARNTLSIPNISLQPLKYSTLVMYDPDAVTSPGWLHYLVINIPNGDISKGDNIISYEGPSPPPGSGSHHYIFEQLSQTSPFTTSIQNRGEFNINQFKKQNNLFSRGKKQFIVNV